MNKSPLLAILLCVITVSSFAQGSADSVGARRVAERDAAYAKQHPSVIHQSAPAAVVKHAHKRHTHRKVKHKLVK